jgi:enolase
LNVVILKKQGKLAGVADEGGYWPEFDGNERAFDTLLEAIEKAGFQPGKDIHLSLDIAASEFYSDGKYHLSLDNRSMKPDQFYALIEEWCREYPIISIEDPFEESDTENWQRLTESIGHTVQIIGDDLYTTDIRRVEEGYRNRLTNSVLIKLNQIGTVTETLNCIRKSAIIRVDAGGVCAIWGNGRSLYFTPRSCYKCRTIKSRILHPVRTNGEME